MASEASWGSFNSSNPAKSELVAQFISTSPFHNDQDQNELNLEATALFSSCHSNCNMYNWSHWNIVTSDTNAEYESYYSSESCLALGINTSSSLMGLSSVDEQRSSRARRLIPNPPFGDRGWCAIEEIGSDDQEDWREFEQPKRKYPIMVRDEDFSEHDHNNDDARAEGPKKQTRAYSQVKKYAEKKGQSKRVKKSSTNREKENNGAINRQSSSCYSSDNDSNASQDMNSGEKCTSSSSKGAATLNLNGKPRAGRGSATDPQSIYARKRRERINERLRILQRLVPNGTKVDISTMLEEAVHYVKFLQLQIKLLSSDELWMYAPIAYNGMNIGLI